jgi:hypothetical protein
VVEVPEELVEAVHRRQELIAIAQVVLAEVAGGVAQRLESLGHCDVACLKAHGRARDTDFRQAGALGVWPVMKDERPAVQLFSA